tara:strand:+ start:143 stop:1255 length:1113 start_codon:yes stop_codon:yes gene_type:complete
MFLPSFKKRKICNLNSYSNTPKDIITNKDIGNFKEDFMTGQNRCMIIHKPFELQIDEKKYINGCKCGSGSFSRVYILSSKEEPEDKGKSLVIKIFKSGWGYEKAAVKEINSLRALKDSPFIVDIVVYFKITDNHIAIVTPFYNFNLFKYIETYLQHTTISYDNFMKVFVSLLNATKCMIENGISSTDMKPENIFLNVNMDGTIQKVVLGDFSTPLYLKTQDKESFNYHVTTKFYRAPEIIFQLDIPHLKYMDLWSIACVMFELHSGSILFDCDTNDSDLDKSNEDLVNKHVSLLGCPSYSYFKKYDLDYCEESVYINSEKYKKFKEPNQYLIKQCSEMPFGLELIIKFLNWDPDERPTPEFALSYIEERL